MNNEIPAWLITGLKFRRIYTGDTATVLEVDKSRNLFYVELLCTEPYAGMYLKMYWQLDIALDCFKSGEYIPI